MHILVFSMSFCSLRLLISNNLFNFSKHLLDFSYSFARQRQTVTLTGQYRLGTARQAGIWPALEFPRCHLVPSDKTHSKVPGDFAGGIVLSKMLL